MKKKILACMLSFMMCVGLTSVTSYAEESEMIDETKPMVCGLVDGCTLENGHEGECIVQPETISEKQAYVAKSGDVQYASLQEAFANAPNNAEIELTKDINDFTTADIATVPAGKSFVLNMAEHSVNAASDFTGRFIVNEGILTVTGNGTMDASMSASGGYGAINNKGTLTIKNGTYRGAIYASGSVIRNTGASAVLTIENGVFEGATCAIYNEGTATLKDGTYTGETCSQCNSGIWSYTIRNTTEASKMTIEGGTYTGVQGAVSASIGYLETNGGTFKSVKCRKNPGHTATYYALYAAGEKGKVKCVINNGHFETEGNNATVVVGNDNTGGDGGINAEATAIIKNGTFVAPEGVPALKGAEKTGDPQILGGIFSSDVSKYIPSGMKQDESGQVVVSENAIAKIGTVAYATLKEAIDTAQAGDKIELLADVTEDIKLDKDIVIDGNEQYEIQGVSTVKQGTLQNLTLTPNEENTSGSLLVLGNSTETKINLENVTLNYSVTKRSTGSAVTVSGNKADITINNCLFTNAPNNNGVVENAPEWSYGLFINEQAGEGKITFTNNEFNGAFRTMLPNISGNMVIEGNKFINSVYSVVNGPTGGSAGEATSITTSKGANNNLVVRNNVFDNAGSMYFQTQINFEENEIKFDKFENYIQAAGGIGEKVDVSNNSFEMGDNNLVIFDTPKAPLILPIGQEAVSGWVFLDTPEDVRPSDYSDYKYMYNEDGTITFKPQSDVALDQFLNQEAGNIKVGHNDTVLIEKDLKVDKLIINKDTAINFEINNNASLEISGNMDVSGNAKISGDGKFIVAEDAKISIEKTGVLEVSKNTNVENNGKIDNDGTLIIPDVVEGDGEVSGSGNVEKLHDAVKVEAEEPTCTKNGVKEHWYCKSCNKYYSDETLETEITKESTVIKAGGHKYDETGKCTVCGAVTEDRAAADKVDALIDAIGSPDNVTLDSRKTIDAAVNAYKALTAGQKKLVTGYEDLCKAIDVYNALLNAEEEKEPEKDPDKDKPIDKPDKDADNADGEDKKPGAVQTGDTTNVAGYMTVRVLAAGIAVFAVIRRKRRG